MIRAGFLVTLLTVSVSGIRYPVTPEVKDPAGIDSSSGGRSANRKREQLSYPARLVLGSGDEVHGSIAGPPEVEFRHYRNGLTFTKTLPVREIRTIRIEEYSGDPVAGKPRADGTYEFRPSRVTIITHTDRKYELEFLFAFLMKIPIRTPDGKSVLFAFYADTWNRKSGWTEIRSRDPDAHRRQPHPMAVREIHFSAPPAGDPDEDQDGL